MAEKKNNNGGRRERDILTRRSASLGLGLDPTRSTFKRVLAEDIQPAGGNLNIQQQKVGTDIGGERTRNRRARGGKTLKKKGGCGEKKGFKALRKIKKTTTKRGPASGNSYSENQEGEGGHENDHEKVDCENAEGGLGLGGEENVTFVKHEDER